VAGFWVASFWVPVLGGEFLGGAALQRCDHVPEKKRALAPEVNMGSNIIDALFIFMLACFIGFEVIRHVSPLLHTPLMSLTNALDAIAVVGAIVLVGEKKSTFATVLGVIAIVAATSNVVGGFIITDRMLKMFKSSRPTKP
jgi:H+-translocating NAD(P) transhydrogenase subunit alpha